MAEIDHSPARLRVFLTGASSGIGMALARAYAQQGAVLGLVARRAPELEALRASLPDAHMHRIYALDVTDHAALQAAAEAFQDELDGADVVIANAGISQGTLTEYQEDLAAFERIMAVNVVAAFATFTPFVARMKALPEPMRRRCRLVGIASVAGIRGLPGAEAYSASKAAVISYCESLRVELRSTGVKVVTIAPGYIDTPMTRVNQYRMPFLMPVQRFAEQALQTIAAGASYRVIPWQMGIVARLLGIAPNWLYDMAFARAPHKKRNL